LNNIAEIISWREALQPANNHFAVLIPISCRTFSISEICCHYQAKLFTENTEAANWRL